MGKRPSGGSDEVSEVGRGAGRRGRGRDPVPQQGRRAPLPEDAADVGPRLGITCRPSIEGALSKFQWTQILGILLGGIIGWIVFYGLLGGNRDEKNDPLLN